MGKVWHTEMADPMGWRAPRPQRNRIHLDVDVPAERTGQGRD